MAAGALETSAFWILVAAERVCPASEAGHHRGRKDSPRKPRRQALEIYQPEEH